DDTLRLVQHLPAALPGEIAEVGILQVKGSEEMIEAAQLEEFTAVECARSTTAIEAGKEILNAVIEAVADAQRAILPPGLGETGLLPLFGGIAEKDLAGDGEDL